MKEYISKDYLNSIINTRLAGSRGAEHYAYNIMKSEIDNATTVDAVEVVHGRWIKQWHDNNLIGHEYEECSVCGCMISDTEKFWDCSYCPNCGAKMDLQ